MSFTTLHFFLFLAMGVLIYYLLPKKLQWVWLLVLSYLYYFTFSIKTSVFLIFTTVVTYTGGILLTRMNESSKAYLAANKETLDRAAKKAYKEKVKKNKRRVVVAMLLLCFGLLGVVKYLNFVIENIDALVLAVGHGQYFEPVNIILPLGISFYTFQSISYIIDVYQGKYSAEKNLFKYALFVSFFPQLLQGPIGRFDRLAHQLYEGRSFSLKAAEFGLQRILWGCFKKMVLADRISPFVTEVFKHSDQYEGMIFFLAAVMYSIQIYCDFSGCMDIVRGTSECFGITLGENFRRPYFSQTLPEFWRRWHISLGAFFREYVFYPVSTSKILLKWNTKVRKYLGNAIGTGFASCVPILCVWILTGLWHGAKWNYIGWGFFHGILICLSTLFEQPVAKLTEKLNIRTNCISWNIFRMLRTFLLCVIGRIIFMGKGIRASFQMITSCIVDYRKIYDLVNDFSISQREWGVIFIGVLILLCVSIAQEIREQIGIKEDIRDWLLRQNLWLRWTVLIAGILCVLIFGVYGTGSQIVFIYEQF